MKREANKKSGKRLNIKKTAFIIIAIFAIIVLFTAVDYFVHYLSSEYAVPSYYFRNKIIYGAVYGAIIYFFVRNQTPFKKALFFSGIAVLLQIRYFIEGYPLDFVLEFLAIHYLILLPISWLAFRYIKGL